MTDLLLWLLAASSAAPSAAQAPDWRWVQVTDHDDGRRAWFIDKASLARDGAKVTFTELAMFRPAGQVKMMQQTTARVDGDCSARTMTIRQHDRTTGEEGPPTTIDAPAGSIGGDMLDSACKARFAGRVRDVPMAAHLMFDLIPRRKRKPR